MNFCAKANDQVEVNYWLKAWNL